MKKFLALSLVLVNLLGTTTALGANLTTDEIYKLDHFLGAIPTQVGLGTHIGTLESGAGTSVLANGKMDVGNGSNVRTAVTPSGDVTISNAGVMAIGAGKVTEAMLLPFAGGVGAVASLGVARTAHLIWDPTAVAAHRTGTAQPFGAGYGATIPPNSLITQVYFYTTTLAASTSNDGTIAFNCLGAGDLLAAIDPDATSGLFAAGAMSSGEITGTQLAHSTKIGLAVAAGCSPTYTVAVHNFTGGRTHIFIEYVPIN